MKDYRYSQADIEIDDALATYISVDPRPGLENRILLRAVTEDGPERFAIAWWAWALPLCACLVLGILKKNEPLATPVMAIKQDTVRLLEKPEPIAAFVRRTARRQPPRRAVFPTITPLTGEERAMLAFVSVASQEDLKWLNGTRDISITPLQIEEIVVTPLQNEPLPNAPLQNEGSH